MPEVLGNAGIYFDPIHKDSIANALRRLIDDADLREQMAASAWQKSNLYSWERCARETLAYVAAVARRTRVFKMTRK
jgi:glycosyltransferase involved in cell wall biosynthesis